ncbi:hypothetical protein FGO68_gene7593 [Halteria grandinella]|uniref:Uncharacterized protein n=1 Tax=Halteria grandinella TaxID=5974 RepID=A0A8J8P345_HALGN|nr:hypothetical protein FGO68_gene7593 [Halteria grandinella]
MREIQSPDYEHTHAQQYSDRRKRTPSNGGNNSLGTLSKENYRSKDSGVNSRKHRNQASSKHLNGKDSTVVIESKTGGAGSHMRMSSNFSTQDLRRQKDTSQFELGDLQSSSIRGVGPLMEAGSISQVFQNNPQTSSKFFPFYEERHAFVDSNYTFRPNQSNLVPESANMQTRGANYHQSFLHPIADEDLDPSLLLLPTPPSVQHDPITTRKPQWGARLTNHYTPDVIKSIAATSEQPLFDRTANNDTTSDINNRATNYNEITIDQNNSGLTRENPQYSSRPGNEGGESINIQKVPMLRGLSEGSRGATSEVYKSSQRYSNQDNLVSQSNFLNYVSPQKREYQEFNLAITSQAKRDLMVRRSSPGKFSIHAAQGPNNNDGLFTRNYQGTWDSGYGGESGGRNVQRQNTQGSRYSSSGEIYRREHQQNNNQRPIMVYKTLQNNVENNMLSPMIDDASRNNNEILYPSQGRKTSKFNTQLLTLGDDENNHSPLDIDHTMQHAYTHRVLATDVPQILTHSKGKKRKQSKKIHKERYFQDTQINEKDMQLTQLSESLVKAREEQNEFDHKMQQVTNLLQELKNNSSGAGYTSQTNTINYGQAQHYDAKSLKLQDLEKTTSQQQMSSSFELLKAENQTLRKKIDTLEKELELQRADITNIIKQKQSKSDLAQYYQQYAKDQANQIRVLEERIEGQTQDLMDLSEDNERIRQEKRQIAEKYRQSCEEKEAIMMKMDKYKVSIKVGEQRVREAQDIIGEQEKAIHSLEEQAGQLIKALQKQKTHDEKVLNDHFQHLQVQIAQLQGENQRLRGQANNHSKSSNAIPSLQDLQYQAQQQRQQQDIQEFPTKKSKSPNLDHQVIQFAAAILKELSCENYFEALARVKDLKLSGKKHLKEKKLISNLQKLVKDCTGQEGFFQHDQQQYQGLAETKSTLNLKSNRTLPYSTVMQTANSTIELNKVTLQQQFNSNVRGNQKQATIQANKDDGLPKVTDIWRWVKNLVQSYIQLQKEHPQGTQSSGLETLHILQTLFSCESPIDLIPTVESLLQFKSDSDRVHTLLKRRYKLPKRASIAEIELYLLQRCQTKRGDKSEPRNANNANEGEFGGKMRKDVSQPIRIGTNLNANE